MRVKLLYIYCSKNFIIKGVYDINLIDVKLVCPWILIGKVC